MNNPYWRITLLFFTIALLIAPTAFGGSPFDKTSPEPVDADVQARSTLHDSDLRHSGLHDAGAFYSPLVDGVISLGFAQGIYDPETGERLSFNTYPNGSGLRYIWAGAIWVGGIVDQDTVVSVGADGWIAINMKELAPEDPIRGSMYRTGSFGDDEFVTTLVDSLYYLDPYSTHGPLGITVRHTSRSWADTAYDDFIIIDYAVLNTGNNYISDGWVGIYLDNDIYQIVNQTIGYRDDFSGSLDTLLYEDDPNSRVFIAYSFDNDGDPINGDQWTTASIPGVIALALLDSDVPFEYINFNWWISDINPANDFGPRRIGTPEDPFHPFMNDNLGTPVSDDDKYYIMSHPEIDYDLIETMIHDSSDGWAPPPPTQATDFADGYDTRFLYSFGPFDLAPGDSVTFTVALAAAATFHVDPGDYLNYYDAFQPDIFQSHLDFSELLTHIRRADSVYQSGYLLPIPGPPAGLRIADYGASFADLVWSPSMREDLGGYDVFIKDTTIDNIWHRVSSGPLLDTAFTVPLFEPTHVYSMAVNLFDTQGRYSALSRPVTLIPGVPHPPDSLTAAFEGGYPELHWRPYEDTAVQVFMIYREAWNDSIRIHDSTAALSYRDYDAESGVFYHYYVTSKNDLGLESEMAGPVEGLYMARDRGVLYNDLNHYLSPGGLYLKEYADRLYNSVAAVTSADRYTISQGYLSLQEMSHYSTIIFEASNKPRSYWFVEDSMRLFLNSGGNAVFIVPALGFYSMLPKMERYGPGNFYRDFFKLDSSYNPGVTASGNGFMGDLQSCHPLIPDYPLLTADTDKLAQTSIPVTGDIPLSGYLFPAGEAEAIYSYGSSNPDTVSNGQINGIRYLGDDYRMVLLCFPILPMSEDNDLDALRRALTDVGVNMACGDADNDGRVNIRDVVFMINYLYRDGSSPEVFANADAVCDGELNMADILVLINLIFKNGWLECCQ